MQTLVYSGRRSQIVCQPCSETTACEIWLDSEDLLINLAKVKGVQVRAQEMLTRFLQVLHLGCFHA